MRLQTITILLFTLSGFALRLRYLTTSHPFFDEYTTTLAARQILQYGWPVLPSGLFYEHGLLATYLIAPFTALFIYTPLEEWQPAQWGLMLARWPSLLISTVTIPLIYKLGRRAFDSGNYAALLAAGLFALSPEGMVWGGRARMYALAVLLTLLTVYWAYKGATYPALSRYRWFALLALAATLLTQFGAIMLVPPLIVGMAVTGWFSRPAHNNTPLWFFRLPILLEGAALTAVVGLAVFVKRLGQPLGVTSLGSADSGNIAGELVNTIAYQTALYFTWPDTVKFLSRQFGVPHHFWLTVVAIAATIVVLAFRCTFKINKPNNFNLFLWLIFGLIILEMVTLLPPFRRNPRYLVIYLPLFYLIAARAIFNLKIFLRPVYSPIFYTITVFVLLLIFTTIGFDDLRIALVTPEPAYEEAFANLYNGWQPGDGLLTMNSPAAALYLGGMDGFTVQNDAKQFLLNADSNPVDRWLGVNWVGNATDFNTALNSYDRTWFVIDSIRQPVYFRGDWLAVINSQMEQVWSNDNAIVYRTRPDRIPLPSQPDTAFNVLFGNDMIKLAGFSLQKSTPAEKLHLTFFFHTISQPPTDYTIFLHLRDSSGAVVAGRDSQPLDGIYPTSNWQPGEDIISPLTLPLPDTLPAGQYSLFAGLYRLDTLERLPIKGDISSENALLLGEIRLP